MGIAILVLWVAAIALTVALFRQRFADAAFGWALRLGHAADGARSGDRRADDRARRRAQLEAARSTAA